MRRRVWVFRLCAGGIVGCQPVDSETVLTSGVYVDLWIHSEGSGSSRARALLRVGGPLSNTVLDLEGDD